jgi:hypothetical protein
MTLIIMIRSFACVCTCAVFNFRSFFFRRASVPSPSAPGHSVNSDGTIDAEKEKLLIDYDDRLTLCESQVHAYRTWLDDDA